MLSAVNGKVMDLRNALYNKGVFGVHDLGARAISVGNITTGGTGKTPLVAHIAAMLASRGEMVCILTRGYGRKNPRERVLVSDRETVLVDAATGGDEPVELAEKLLGKAFVVADADRVSAAEWAKRNFGVTAFILDDGFQHRRAKRDLDIVCVDATNPFGGGKMLPAGRLREPAAGLSRADAIVITRSGLVDDIAELKAKLRKYAPDVPIFEARDRVERVRSLFGEDELAPNTKFVAFCGIGNPDYLFKTANLHTNGESVGTLAFSDHHSYTQKDVENIEEKASTTGAEALVTTAKDAVKLGALRFSLPCFVLEITPEIEPAGEFEKLILG
jgi:tetraacyldisaccharide 4'-kinase